MTPHNFWHLFVKAQRIDVIRSSSLQSALLNIRCAQHIPMSTKVFPTQTTKASFEAALPSIINTLVTHKDLAEVPEVGNWLKKFLEYTLEGGKKARGLTTVIAFEMLEKPENITEESLHIAKVLGWCSEILHATVMDDVMDGSPIRHKKPCWHQLPEVGLQALTNNLALSAIFHVIKTYFEKEKIYKDLLDLFYKTVFYIAIGQHLDVAVGRSLKFDLSLFTTERYYMIAKYKSSSHSYILPISLGMLLAGISNPALHKLTEDICTEIGILFQIQDDYIDCYGDQSVTGKASVDIQTGKCTWLAVTALQRCIPAQRVVFTACYGSQEPAHIDRIKELYRQLELPKLYAQEETRMYESLMKKVHELPRELPPALFTSMIDNIYKRNN